MVKVVNNAGEVIEVTETAFNILYKERGFTPYVEEKKTTSSSSKKKVKTDGSKSK